MMREEVKSVANNLWSIVDNSDVYSFEKKPLVVFRMFVSIYLQLSQHEDLPAIWLNYLRELLDYTNQDFEEEASSELFDQFIEALHTEVHEVNVLSEIVDFFIDKYITISTSNTDIPVISNELINFIYWYATGVEACTTELAIYNPYAGYGALVKEHNLQLKSQLENSIENENDMKEISSIEESFKSNSWYHGVENNVTLRLMANTRLLINEPLNWEQMFVHAGKPEKEDMNDFSGGWTLITMPQLNSYKEVHESDVKVVSSLVEKFIDATGMVDAFIVLPKFFCYDKSYYSLRRKLVRRGILGSVVELRKESFKNPFDGVIVHLCKSSLEDNTILVDGQECNDRDELLDVCLEEEKSDICFTVEDYLLAQCDYCLLPSLYISGNKGLPDNEDLNICYTKYQSLMDLQAKSEEKRIAHRNISGQLSHMLGATYHKIYDAISELKYAEGFEDTYFVLHDSFDYMKRLINTIDEDFSTATMNFDEVSVNDFIKSYCRGWSVYGKKAFSVYYESNIGDDTTFKIDEVFMKVLLDAILVNANKHGFVDNDIQSPQIKITTAYTRINNIECINLCVANNGVPFPENFTMEKYIKEGEFGGNSGNTGRGGYHVYLITKRHKGYISLSKDNEWNVKLNIMIPIEFYDESETEKFIEYEEEYM